MTTRAPVDWTVVEDENGVAFRWAFEGDDLVAEWIGVLTVRATRKGELTAFQPVFGAPEALVEKTKQGVVAAFLRAQRHQRALHASAVSLHDKALACVGGSGLGKSTMAERMCRRTGAKLLADDIAAIDILPNGEVHVLPSEAVVWLATADSMPKVPVRTTNPAASPAALKSIVSLVFDEGARTLEVREVRAADAVSALVPSLIRFDREPLARTTELAWIGQLVSQSRVLEMRRSRDLALDTVVDALLELLEGAR
jgi:hypothetical protein